MASCSSVLGAASLSEDQELLSRSQLQGRKRRKRKRSRQSKFNGRKERLKLKCDLLQDSYHVVVQDNELLRKREAKLKKENGVIKRFIGVAKYSPMHVCVYLCVDVGMSFVDTIWTLSLRVCGYAASVCRCHHNKHALCVWTPSL